MNCKVEKATNRDDWLIFLTVFGRFGFLNPIGQMANKVEEEIFFGHRNDLVGNFHEKTETFVRLECQPLGNALAKVLGPGRGINFESLSDRADVQFD